MSDSVVACGAREKNSWRLSWGPEPARTYWWLRANRTWGEAWGGGGGGYPFGFGRRLRCGRKAGGCSC
jgi:hypothetical protein